MRSSNRPVEPGRMGDVMKATIDGITNQFDELQINIMHVKEEIENMARCLNAVLIPGGSCPQECSETKEAPASPLRNNLRLATTCVLECLDQLRIIRDRIDGLPKQEQQE